MDPASIVTSVLSTVLVIKRWVDDTRNKNQAIADISQAINLVHLILSPLEEMNASRNLQPTVIACLLSIGEVLSRIKDHLSVWKDSRIRPNKLLGFIIPSTVVSDLRDDALLLSQHIQMVSFALQVSTFLAEQPTARLPRLEPVLLDSVKNAQVREFWRDMIGEETYYISGVNFWKAINTWLKEDLNESLFAALLLRIDEFGINGITLSSLDRFVGEKTISDAFGQLQGREEARNGYKSFDSVSSRNASKPWLVWVDDNPGNNLSEVCFAQENGICVFHFFSTASAKAWIDANEDELRQQDDCHQLRFITDNARWESHEANNISSGELLNLSAGEAILRFLRGRQYTAPVLVYCGASIVLTSYVLVFQRAGSTTSSAVCIDFISALATRTANDGSWEKFGASNEESLSLLLDGSISDYQLPTRHSRFGDRISTEFLCNIGGGGGSLRSFYNGLAVSERMAAVREAIVYIRTHWNEYPKFIDDLRSYLQEAQGSMATSLLSDALEMPKEWADRRLCHPFHEDYSIIRLYTTESGFTQIFKTINNAFRQDELTTNSNRLRSAVFLVELLNIELFNYLFMNQSTSFTGIVYRGLCLSSEPLEQFMNMTTMPVKDRFWAIPLAMISCTMDENLAVEFATQEAAAAGSMSVLWRIHIAELDKELLDIYQARFPSSVVTTLCAVPIKEVSEYPAEEEVILRGPFFQLIRVHTRQLDDGTSMNIMDSVVFNTNRDHPSTMELEGSEGRQARELFACLIAIARAKLCKELTTEFGMVDDAGEYDLLHRTELERLQVLTT